MRHLLDRAARGRHGLGQLVAAAETSGDCDHDAGRDWDLAQRGGEALGSCGREHRHRHHAIRVEERRLQHTVLKARGVEALALEAFEPEIGDELRSPAVKGGPGPLLDEEPLVAVEQMDVGFGFGVRHELSAAIVPRPWISTWAR